MKLLQRSLLSLSNDSFKNYLFLNYVTGSSDPTLEKLSYISTDAIEPEMWVQLYNFAKADVEKTGGQLHGYEVVNEKIVKHEKLRSELWPANWMWVISKNSI